MRIRLRLYSPLGGDHFDVPPELLRLAELYVRIPRMEIIALDHVAAREGKTVSRVLGGSCSTAFPSTRSGFRATFTASPMPLRGRAAAERGEESPGSGIDPIPGHM